jgi:hypothetical protein
MNVRPAFETNLEKAAQQFPWLRRLKEEDVTNGGRKQRQL